MPGNLRLGLAIACLAGTGLWACGVVAGGRAPVLYPDSPPFGAYDPAGHFRHDPAVSIDHHFVPWREAAPAAIAGYGEAAAAAGRSLLITLEARDWHAEAPQDPVRLRDGLLAGEYDGIIDGFCRAFGALPVPVMVRWGHEMESHDPRYPWAAWSPADYVRAYRHFVDRCRQSAPEADFVWSPLGHARLVDYFPGAEHVDIVGLSVFGLQAYDRMEHGRDRDFFEVFAERYGNVASFGLPVMIAELGYSGDAAFVATWARQALAVEENYPAPVAVVYFNAREVADWPDGLGLPDWRVERNIVNASRHDPGGRD